MNIYDLTPAEVQRLVVILHNHRMVATAAHGDYPDCLRDTILFRKLLRAQDKGLQQ